jgi:DNA mismatch repair protein MutL
MPINILPTHLVNKIAAGEVIERPASVVKELVENAIDAGATQIDVVIEEGGSKRIAVTDNGGGMGPEDLARAFIPHATSKITCDEDLFNIFTMGFRGEALASIASISHARIVTRPTGQDEGWQIDSSGETTGDVRPAAAAEGTSVFIDDLFFNTPARRKFLRKASTEYGHIAEQLTRLALPHPQIAFTLSHNGRETVNLPPASSTAQRIGDLLGSDVAAELIPIAAGDDSLSVAGLISSPAAARGSSKWQYVFLNGRYVRDRLLAHALKEAYRGLVDPSRFPLVFAFIQIDPEDVDVNVHPTKIEVRFRNGQAVHSVLLTAMRDALNQAQLNPSVRVPAPELVSEEPSGARQASLRQALTDFFRSPPKPAPTLSFPQAPPPVSDDSAAAGAVIPAAYTPPAGDTFESEQAAPTAMAAQQPALFQVANTFIVVGSDDGVEIIDQHALHERILYNEFRARMMDAPLEAQQLLIPATVTITAHEADLLNHSADLLARVGIGIESFGPNTVAIQRFPSLLTARHTDPARFLRALLDRLSEDEAAHSEHLLEHILEVMACKAAIKAGDPLSQPEMMELLAKRHGLEQASACPHGRPTTLTLSLDDLARQFQRH